MSNIINQLKSSISTQVLSSLSEKLGESESGIAKALGAAFPALISGFMEKAGESGSQGTMNEVMGLLKNTAFPDKPESTDILDSLTEKGSLFGVGKKFLSLIFGNKITEITSFIAKFAGLKDTSASSLLSLASPLLLGNLSKKVKNENLSLSGLTSSLLNDKDEIIKSAPAGLASILGLSDIGKIGSKVKSSLLDEASNIGNKAEHLEKQAERFIKKTRSPLWWILPLLVALGLLLFFWKGCAKQEANLINQQQQGKVQVEQVTKNAQDRINNAAVYLNVKETVDNAETLLENVNNNLGETSGTIGAIKNEAAETANQVSDSATDLWSHLGDFSSRLLPNNVRLHLPELGIERKVLDFIENDEKALDKTSWFSFDRLLFETNSAVLKADSNEQLTNVAEIMNAFPNVKIKVGGYTDNTGHPEANLNLSQNRAEAVKTDLVKLGISQDRIEAEGYGEQHPIASNETPEGRAQNRRIDMLITAK